MDAFNIHSRLQRYNKLSYCRERAHLTSLYRTVQKAFGYVEPFKGLHINHCQCWNKSYTKWIYGCRSPL